MKWNFLALLLKTKESFSFISGNKNVTYMSGNGTF